MRIDPKVLYVVGNMAIACISLVNMPMVLRVLSLETFGEIVVVQAVAALLASFAIPHSWQIVANDTFNERRPNMEQRLRAALGVDFLSILSFLAITPVTLFVFFQFYDFSIGLGTLAALFVITGVSDLSAVYGFLRFKRLVGVLVFLHAIAPLARLIIAPLYIYNSSFTEVIDPVHALFVFPELVRILLILAFAIVLAFRIKGFSIRPDKDMTRFLHFQRLGRVSRIPSEFADRLILGYFLGASGVGIYQVGRRIGAAVAMAVEPWIQLSFGEISKIPRIEGTRTAALSIVFLCFLGAFYFALAAFLLDIEFVRELVFSQENMSRLSENSDTFYLGLGISILLGVLVYANNSLNIFRLELYSSLVDLACLIFLLGVFLVTDTRYFLYFSVLSHCSYF